MKSEKEKVEELRVVRILHILPFFILMPFILEAQIVANRTVGDIIIYYSNLNEAFAAADGTSFDQPDEISLLADIVLTQPIIIGDRKHIVLVPEGGSRIIHRDSGFLDYPLFWITGDSASLSLGKSGMEHELVIDGGYMNITPVEANAPLIALNGPYSKLIMHDKVTLQNNCNAANEAGASYYQSGSGVFIHTDFSDRPAEFIMKGGSISGNFNKVNNPYPSGGGVLILNYGSFTMEGGVIFNNTVQRTGGGVFISNTASFYKSGGIIYGKDAPLGLRNTAMDGSGSPNVHGHAILVGLNESANRHYRNDTVNENDNLTYTGSPRGDGVFGKGEKWHTPRTIIFRNLLIVIIPLLAFSLLVLLFIRKRTKGRQQEKTSRSPSADLDLTPREKEVFDLLMSGSTAKQIAQALQLSVSSVNFHSQNIYRKLGIQSRTELLVKFRA